jgi:hypothetical protein
MPENGKGMLTACPPIRPAAGHRPWEKYYPFEVWVEVKN